MLLKHQGYDVDVLTYRPLRFFDAEVEAAGVPVRRVASSKLRRPFAVRRAIRERDPDVLIAFLDGPNVYAELAALPSRRFALIVSERAAPARVGLSHRVRFALHRRADVVVTNSYQGRLFVRQVAPWLSDQIEVISNTVDLDLFRPAPEPAVNTDQTRVLVLARYATEKNPSGMLAAMEWLHRNAPAAPIVLDWHGRIHLVEGRPGPLAAVYLDLQRAIRDRGVDETFRLHDAAQDVIALYHGASLVCLPSYHEGCSNVVCEALASGVPVVASDVGDNNRLVIDGETGFLCDPTAPQTIGEAILRFHGMSDVDKRRMGLRARAHAEGLLAPRRFVASYVALIDRLHDE